MGRWRQPVSWPPAGGVCAAAHHTPAYQLITSWGCVCVSTASQPQWPANWHPTTGVSLKTLSHAHRRRQWRLPELVGCCTRQGRGGHQQKWNDIYDRLTISYLWSIWATNMILPVLYYFKFILVLHILKRATVSVLVSLCCTRHRSMGLALVMLQDSMQCSPIIQLII